MLFLDRRVLCFPVVWGVVLVAWSGGCAHPESKSPTYNVLFIMGDDFSVGELGCYGSEEFRTPHIDALAAGGAWFDTCWATPLCQPSRVQLITGRYGFRTRFYHNWMAPAEPVIRHHCVFPQVLKDHGVITAMAGKWHHSGPPWDYGFVESCISWGVSCDWAAGDVTTRPGYLYWQPMIFLNRRLRPTGPEDYGPDIGVDFLVDFMTRHKDRTFFACFSPILAHSPHLPTPDSLKPGMDKLRHDTTRNFRANVEYLDKLVGRLVAAVDRLDLRDRTIIIFTTDNGTPPAKAHALEEGCRVPLIVNGPDVLKIKGRRQELIDFADLAPTFAELTGATWPSGETIDGHSFASLLLGKPYRQRDWIFSYCGEERMLRDRRWLYEGGGRFYDTNQKTASGKVKEVTESSDPQVVAARQRFHEILAQLPAPPPDEPLFESYREQERQFLQKHPGYSILAY